MTHEILGVAVGNVDLNFELKLKRRVRGENYCTVLAGVVLVFSTVAGLGLYFEFVLKTALITQGCFSFCWAVFTHNPSCFCSSPHPTSEEAGDAQGAGMGHNQDS